MQPAYGFSRWTLLQWRKDPQHQTERQESPTPKKLLSLALALALALTLAPAAFAAGQFTDVPDTSPFAAPVSWAVEQGVWREDGFTTGNVFEYLIEGNTYTYMWRSGDGKERQYASAPFKVEGPNEKGAYYLRVSDGGLHPYITYKEGEGLSTSEYGLGTPASKLGLSDTYLVCS